MNERVDKLEENLSFEHVTFRMSRAHETSD
jgi:hypothetical protein